MIRWNNLVNNHVVVTGSFDSWSNSIVMTKNDGGFEASVDLNRSVDIYFKFVVDGVWCCGD